MAKNLMGKSRKPESAYVVVEAAGWKWYILKMYKSVANSEKDAYARAFCLVKSPYVPSGEYGDVYLMEIGKAVGRAELFASLYKAESDIAEGKVC